MEDEQFFLFIIYFLEQEKSINREGKIYIESKLKIMRAAMQKKPGEMGDGSLYKRVAVDFDPLNEQMVYCVVARGSRLDISSVFDDVVYFPGVVTNQPDAEKIRDEFLNSGYKEVFKKKEKFLECYVDPILVSAK